VLTCRPSGYDGGLTVYACTACDHVVFPRRLACPHCGGSEFIERVAEEGVLEEATASRAGVAIGSIRTDAGPVVLARLLAELEPGARVRLWQHRGVLATPAR
jgi:uncharacterized OB-fold protein